MNELKAQYFAANKRKRMLIFLFFILNILAALWSLNVGASDMSMKTVWRVLCDLFVHDDTLTTAERVIVLRVRLPHVVTSVLAGVLLAASGLIMQDIFQNPLVSPYTMGVSNGASCGAAIAMVCEGSIPFLSRIDTFAIPLFAFAFAALTMYLVQLLGKLASDTTKSLILAGIAVGYLFSAIVSYIKYTCDSDKLPELVFWQMGSVSATSWPKIGIMLCAALIGVMVLYEHALDMNVLATGEETARSLGIDYKSVRRLAFVVSTMMTGVAVAFTGTIGFVGLVSPHIARKLVGNDCSYNMSMSLLCGSLLLLVSDALSRGCALTYTLPIGIITSFIGVPFFVWIIIQKRQEV